MTTETATFLLRFHSHMPTHLSDESGREPLGIRGLWRDGCQMTPLICTQTEAIWQRSGPSPRDQRASDAPRGAHCRSQQ